MELPAYCLPFSAQRFVAYVGEKARILSEGFHRYFYWNHHYLVPAKLLTGLNIVEDSTNSILASIGSFIAPLFILLGFHDWRASTALLSGITAKESVKSTLAVLTGAASDSALSSF